MTPPNEKQEPKIGAHTTSDFHKTGNWELFELMSQEHDLTLTEGQMWDIIECVRKLIKQEGGE